MARNALKHTVGFIAEIKASLYFAENDYEIYWPSFSQSSCDFIITKGSEIQRVQVKSAYWIERPSGLRYLQATTRKGSGTGGYKEYTNEDCDLIAIVHQEELWLLSVQELAGRQSLCLRHGQASQRAGTFNAEIYRVR